MGVDVKGPGQANQPAVNQKAPPGAIKQAGLTGAQARLNAEAMFDKSFGISSAAEAPPMQPSIVADDVATPKIKEEIVSVFNELKAQHLKSKPDGKAAEAFTSSKLSELAAGATVESTTAALPKDLSGLPKEVRQALGQVMDALMQRKMDSIVLAQQMFNTPAHALLQSPQGQAAMAKVAPLLKAMSQWMMEPLREKDKKDQKSNAKAGDTTPAKGNESGANAEGVSGPEAHTQLETLSNKIAQALKPIGKHAQELPMDFPLESLIIIALNGVAKDAEDDLRIQLNEMQRITKLKETKRHVIAELKKQDAAIRSEAQKQLDQLKKDKKVRQDVSLDEYLSYCQVTTQAPNINNDSGDWQISPAVMTPPNPLPEAWKPEAETSSSGGRTIESLGDIAGLQKISKALVNVGTMTLTTSPGTGGGSGGAENGSNATYGQPENGNYSVFADQIAAQDSDLQSLSAQSDIQQMQMQIYMDRRQKALELQSNSLKKLADLSDGIIKNTL